MAKDTYLGMKKPDEYEKYLEMSVGNLKFIVKMIRSIQNECMFKIDGDEIIIHVSDSSKIALLSMKLTKPFIKDIGGKTSKLEVGVAFEYIYDTLLFFAPEETVRLEFYEVEEKKGSKTFCRKRVRMIIRNCIGETCIKEIPYYYSDALVKLPNLTFNTSFFIHLAKLKMLCLMAEDVGEHLCMRIKGTELKVYNEYMNENDDDDSNRYNFTYNIELGESACEKQMEAKYSLECVKAFVDSIIASTYAMLGESLVYIKLAHHYPMKIMMKADGLKLYFLIAPLVPNE